ncbi:thioesterase family protein [Streptomyces sp. 796.1]|uniref:thioesterase family protein n=1 Tax=Streptomyces sp. 796.1 TaxID=3163029 RepID=UPI0039C93394
MTGPDLLPLPVHAEPVRPEWIDYNGHLSEAYYVLVFGHATDALMDHAGLDADYRRRTGCSLYTVEAHVRYLREVPQGSALTVRTRLLGVAGGKAHFTHEMYAAPGPSTADAARGAAGAGDAPAGGGVGGGVGGGDQAVPPGELVATEELFALHVDQHTGRTTPLPQPVLARLLPHVEPAPRWAGRGIRSIA